MYEEFATAVPVFGVIALAHTRYMRSGRSLPEATRRLFRRTRRSVRVLHRWVARLCGGPLPTSVEAACRAGLRTGGRHIQLVAPRDR